MWMTWQRFCCWCRYGFVVYGDGTVTDVACKGLNGMRMGDRTLTVRRATEVMCLPLTIVCVHQKIVDVRQIVWDLDEWQKNHSQESYRGGCFCPWTLCTWPALVCFRPVYQQNINMRISNQLLICCGICSCVHAPRRLRAVYQHNRDGMAAPTSKCCRRVFLLYMHSRILKQLIMLHAKLPKASRCKFGSQSVLLVQQSFSNHQQSGSFPAWVPEKAYHACHQQKHALLACISSWQRQWWLIVAAERKQFKPVDFFLCLHPAGSLKYLACMLSDECMHEWVA